MAIPKKRVRLSVRTGLEADINTAATKNGSMATGYSAAIIGELFAATDIKVIYFFDGTENVPIARLTLDNLKLLFGTGVDASIYYDGTNLIIDPKEVGSGILSILGSIQVESYERHIQIPALLTGNAANTPTPVDDFTAGGLQFAQTVEKFAFVQWEIPDDWAGDDIFFEVDWYPDATALADPDVVEWTIEYRAIAPGEAINNGTSVTVSPAYDAGVSGALAQYVTEHTIGTLTFDNANQPLTKQDHVFFKISRNVAVTNDFNSSVVVPAFEIIYNSTTLPTN